MGAEPGTVPALRADEPDGAADADHLHVRGRGVALTLTFMTPALPEDIDVLSRPVTYLTYEFQSTDGKTHEVGVLLRRLRRTHRQRPATGGRLVACEAVGELGVLEDRFEGPADPRQEGRRPPHRLGLPLRGRAEVRRSTLAAAPRPTPAAASWTTAAARSMASCRRRRAASDVAVAALVFELRQGRRPARLPLAHARLRRPLLDPVHEEEPAALLASQRLGSRRPAQGRRQGLRVAQASAAPRSTPS